MDAVDLALKVGMDTSGLARGQQEIDRTLGGIGQKSSDAAQKTNLLGNAFGSLASKINPAAMAAAAAGAAFAAVGAGIVSSISTAGNFQQAMANVASVTGGGAESMAKLSAAAREAGATTVFSASQSADAMYFLASAGYDTGQIVNALGDTLEMAAASGMDLASASEIMTGTIAQFKFEAEDAGRVSNVFAAAAAATNTTISQLGAGMSYVGSLAAEVGISIEETTATLGMLANANIKGERGGSALRASLSALLKPSGEAKAAIEAMGLSIEQVDPTTNSFADILGRLEEGGMTAAQAITIFGKEYGPVMLGLVGKGSEELRTLTEQITGTSKSSEMAATMTATFQGAMTQLGSAVEGAKIAVGSVFLPILTSAVNSLSSGVRAVTAFGQALGTAITSSNAVSALKTFGQTLKTQIVDNFSKIAEPLGNVKDAINNAFGGDALGAAVNFATAGLTVIITAATKIIEVFKPIGSAVASGLGTALQSIADTITKVSDGLNKAKEFGSAFIDAFKGTDAFQSLASTWESFNNKFQQGIDFAKTKWDEVKTSISHVVTEVQEHLSPVIDYVVEKFGQLVAWIERITGVDFSSLIPDVGGIKSGVIKRGGIAGDIVGAVDKAWAVTFGEDVGDGIADGIASSNLQNAIPDTIDDAKPDVVSASEDLGKESGEAAGKAFSNEMKTWMASAHAAGMRAIYSEGSIIGWESKDVVRRVGSADFSSGGVTYTYAWDRTSKYPTLKLFADGVEIKKLASVDYGDVLDGIDTPWAMMESVGLKTPERGSAEWHEMVGGWMSGIKGISQTTIDKYGGLTAQEHLSQAAILRIAVPVEAVPLWSDLDKAKWMYDNRAIEESFTGKSKLVMEWAEKFATDGNEATTNAMNLVLQGLLKPTAEYAPVMEAALSELFNPYIVEKIMAEYWAAIGAIPTDVIVDLEKALETQMKAIGETAGNALSDGIVDVQEQKTLNEMVTAFEKIGGDATDALIQAIQAGNWEEVGKIVGDRFGTGLVEGFSATGAKLSAELMEARRIEDQLFSGAKEFWELDPATQKSYMDTYIRDKRVWWTALLKIDTEYQLQRLNDGKFSEEWYWTMLTETSIKESDRYTTTQLKLIENARKLYGDLAQAPVPLQKALLEMILDMDKVATKTKDQATNLANLTAEASMCEEAMSAFGIAQEKAADEMFFRSYIGPTSGYAAFLAEEEARGAFHPAPISLGSYTPEFDMTSISQAKTELTEVEQVSQGLSNVWSNVSGFIDTSTTSMGSLHEKVAALAGEPIVSGESPVIPAEPTQEAVSAIASDVETLIDRVETADPVMNIKADTTQAYLELQSLLTSINNSYATVNVGVNILYDDIAAVVASVVAGMFGSV